MYLRDRFVEVARHERAGTRQSHGSGATLVELPSAWKGVMCEERGRQAWDEGGIALLRSDWGAQLARATAWVKDIVVGQSLPCGRIRRTAYMCGSRCLGSRLDDGRGAASTQPQEACMPTRGLLLSACQHAWGTWPVGCWPALYGTLMCRMCREGVLTIYRVHDCCNNCWRRDDLVL